MSLFDKKLSLEVRVHAGLIHNNVHLNKLPLFHLLTEGRFQLLVTFSITEALDEGLLDDQSATYNAYKLLVAKVTTFRPYPTLEPLERPVVLEVEFG